MVSGSVKCAKYTLFVFNLIYFLAGIALIVIGSLVVATKFSENFDFFGGGINSTAIFLIVVGAVITLVSFLGYCGAIKESYGMLVTYSVFLGVIIILQVAGYAALYVSRGQIQNELADSMDKTIPNYNKTDVTVTWNIIQEKLMCCGVNNYTDWEDNEYLSRTDSVPDSCCHNITKGCGYKAVTSGGVNVYKDGCARKLRDLLEGQITLLGGVAIGIVVVKVLGLILALVLACSLRKEYQSV